MVMQQNIHFVTVDTNKKTTLIYVVRIYLSSTKLEIITSVYSWNITLKKQKVYLMN